MHAATVTSQPNKVWGNTQGLAAIWTMNGPDFIATITDRSGNGNHGFLVGQSTTSAKTAGKLGQALKLNETGYITAGTNNVLNMTGNAMTLSLWLRRVSSSATGAFVTRGSSGANGYTFALGVSPCTANQIKATKFGVVDACLSGFPSGTEWHHVVVTWGSTGALLYVDGVQVGTNANTANFITAPGATFTIGSFSSSLDDVRVYNRTLSAQEVRILAGVGQVTIKTDGTATTTIKAFTCGQSTVKDADGNVYNTLKIGTQCWMKQNMRVGTRINVAGNQSNNSIIEKYCYADTASNCTTNHPNQPDGGLYQWNEAMQYSSTPGAQGICPAGWHIPTHDQFTTLERSVCTSGSCATDFPYDITTTGYRGTTEGTNLKPNGTSLFEGNLAGYSFGGSFYVRGTVGFFWSSLGSGGIAWSRFLGSGVAQVYR